ncbi:hypothetical protein PAGA_a0273 [Pseudoalteromonas agarivorans DSM 14585]|uniref:Uncharacterized protein n=1 Tax=Pseudoalteromonas agarivorans DSM 14585 TaxID=1312369 RepID=A0ACA8DSA7_9GAMM|nr:hypothetical protein PAGA_a0273 [Pseudoalteromonas agarivorans DSM 14585]
MAGGGKFSLTIEFFVNFFATIHSLTSSLAHLTLSTYCKARLSAQAHKY